MKTLDTKLVLNLGPKKGNPRNSEGSFIRADDGSIWHTYSQYCGDVWYDHQPSNIAFIRSTDEGETWSEPEIIVRAEQLGFDFVGTTLNGYTEDTKDVIPPNFDLIHRLAVDLKTPIIAEGGIFSPAELRTDPFPPSGPAYRAHGQADRPSWGSRSWG